MNSNLNQVKIINLPHHFEENGDLIVMEKKIQIYHST